MSIATKNPPIRIRRTTAPAIEAREERTMSTINIQSAKLTVVFRAGELPRVDPANPRFTINLGGVKIQAVVNAKAARKLAVHDGGTALQGRLISDHGQLVLLDAGFQWFEKPHPVAAPNSCFANPPA